MTGTAGKQYNFSALEILDGFPHIMALSDALDIHSRHNPRVYAALAEYVPNREAVHGSGQHAHPVGTDPLDLSGTVLDTAPEIAAADYDPNFCALGKRLLHTLTDRSHKVKIKACTLSSAEGFSADFNQDSLVFHAH